MNELPPVNSPETTQVSIKIKSGGEDIPLPRYMSAAAAGMDIHAAVDDEIVILPGERVLVSTGIAIALPEGFEALGAGMNAGGAGGWLSTRRGKGKRISPSGQRDKLTRQPI